MDENYFKMFEDKQPEHSPNEAAAEAENDSSSSTGAAADTRTQTEQFSSTEMKTEEYTEPSSSDETTPGEENERTSPNSPVPDPRIDELAASVTEVKSAADAIGGKVDSLAGILNSIKSDMSRLSAYDTAVEQLKLSLAANRNTEKKLYEEVEEYKKDVYFTNIKPFLMFLINMLCELKKSKEDYLKEEEEFLKSNSKAVFDEIIQLIDFYIQSFSNQLEIQGVTIISYEPKTDYIQGEHRIKDKVKTDDPELDLKTERVLSDCYKYGKNILKEATVTVYKYVKPENA